LKKFPITPSEKSTWGFGYWTSNKSKIASTENLKNVSKINGGKNWWRKKPF
jgi:hypothetical protein